jgi:hypothetical protein
MEEERTQVTRVTSMVIQYFFRAHRKRKSKLGGPMIGAACVKRLDNLKSA